MTGTTGSRRSIDLGERATPGSFLPRSHFPTGTIHSPPEISPQLHRVISTGISPVPHRVISTGARSAAVGGAEKPAVAFSSWDECYRLVTDEWRTNRELSADTLRLRIARWGNDPTAVCADMPRSSYYTLIKCRQGRELTGLGSAGWQLRS